MWLPTFLHELQQIKFDINCLWLEFSFSNILDLVPFFNPLIVFKFLGLYILLKIKWTFWALPDSIKLCENQAENLSWNLVPRPISILCSPATQCTLQTHPVWLPSAHYRPTQPNCPVHITVPTSPTVLPHLYTEAPDQEKPEGLTSQPVCPPVTIPHAARPESVLVINGTLWFPLGKVFLCIMNSGLLLQGSVSKLNP